MTIIDHPVPEAKPKAPSIVLTGADRIGLARVLHKQMTYLGQTGRKESWGRFLGRLERRRIKSKLISPQTARVFMLRDSTRLVTLDRVAKAFELEGGHKELIELARHEAYNMGLYKNPQHVHRHSARQHNLQLSLFNNEGETK
jgi:hypothetical protein